MNRPLMIMMVGLVGSGKSTKAKPIAELYNANIHSSDSIREELSGDINNQDINELVFKTLHNRIKEDLRNGKNCVYDACNTSYKRRMAFLQELKNIPCEKICVLMATPYKECLKNNANRDRVVPEEVIKKMYMNFNIPYWYEGWDDIQIIGAVNGRYDVGYKVAALADYHQGNSHHKLTLGWHLWKTRDYYDEICGIDDYDTAGNVAALLHDISKPFCRTNANSKGINDGNAHYYNHQYVSAYDSLFINSLQNKLDVAIRIMWHMQPYFWKKDNNEKSHNKYRKLWGEELYKDIMKLHEADLAAH